MDNNKPNDSKNIFLIGSLFLSILFDLNVAAIKGIWK